MSIFSLTIIVIIFSILRVALVNRKKVMIDITWLYMWSITEVAVCRFSEMYTTLLIALTNHWVLSQPSSSLALLLFANFSSCQRGLTPFVIRTIHLSGAVLFYLPSRHRTRRLVMRAPILERSFAPMGLSLCLIQLNTLLRWTLFTSATIAASQRTWVHHDCYARFKNAYEREPSIN